MVVFVIIVIYFFISKIKVPKQIFIYAHLFIAIESIIMFDLFNRQTNIRFVAIKTLCDFIVGNTIFLSFFQIQKIHHYMPY